MSDVIRFEHLGKFYPVGPGVHALRDVSLRIEQGAYVAIMGPSGSGKSTLLNLLGCLDRPSSGKYWLNGEDVSAMNDNQLSDVRNRLIGFVFQSFNLIPGVSILQNIEVPMFYSGLARRQRHPRSVQLAETVGLAGRLDHKPAQLSGGQQQRVAIARALANDPVVLVADEPTGNLDSRTAGDILRLLDDLHARGRTIVMVTHEEDVAARAQRVVLLRDGQVESDTANAPAAAPAGPDGQGGSP